MHTDIITFGVIELEVQRQLENVGVKPDEVISGPCEEGFFLKVQANGKVAYVTLAPSPWIENGWEKIYIAPAVAQIYQCLTGDENAR